MDLDNYEKQYRKELITSEKWNRVSNFIKSLGFPIISIVLLLAITLPESTLNKTISKEKQTRERTKLVLEVLKNNDPITRSLSLEFLRDFYPEINEDFLRIEQAVLIQAINEYKVKIKIYQEKLLSCSDCTVLEKSNIEMNIELCKIKLKQLKKRNKN